MDTPRMPVYAPIGILSLWLLFALWSVEIHLVCVEQVGGGLVVAATRVHVGPKRIRTV